jgi:superfamily II DNA/RNA helicase
VDISISEILQASAARQSRDPRPQYSHLMNPVGTTTPAQKETNEPRGDKPKKGATWERTGLREAVVQALVRAFPDAHRVNDNQRRMLQVLQNGHSLMMMCPPGQGKSFAIAVWLLTLERAQRLVRDKDKSQLTTTALIIAPNIDLVLQYHFIVTELLKATQSKAIMNNPAGFVQAIHRGETLQEQMELLKTNPDPHILIATPTVLLDILSDKNPEVRNLVDCHSLKTIVVEEADNALARYDNPYDGGPPLDEDKPKDPLLILLDYVFASRKVAAVKAKKKPTQPQLVFPTAATGPSKLRRKIETYHPSWLDGENRPGFTPFSGKGKLTPASSVVTLSNYAGTGAFPLLVPDNLTHHILAYDPTTGFLRDAPVPVYNLKDTEHINSELKASNAYEKSLEKSLATALEDTSRDQTQLDQLLKSFGNLAPEVKRRGYPAHIAADVLERLLEHDNYPRNVIVALGEMAPQKLFQEVCAARGITTRSLRINNWNENAEAEGRLPLGRTDKLFGHPSSPSSPQESSSPGGREEDTIVWVSNYFPIRGLDVPNIRHLYILHRLDRVREYITYAGRAGRWPYLADEAPRDARAMGRDLRPWGKVVNVVLEERGTELVGDQGKGYTLVRADGGEVERWVWQKEGLRLAKAGVVVGEVFYRWGGDRGESGEFIEM